MKQYKTKFLAWLVISVMLLSVLAPAVPALASDTITINTAEEFIDFAKKCTLDTWSQGKTVKLLGDIDLSGKDPVSVPTFGGLFDGGGFTVSGVSLTNAGSNQGLFRYIQPGAIVQNLTVTGDITPGGSKNTVGGIAANNSGIIQSCNFSGTVSGKENVGGIVGINTEAGQIRYCTADGSISGERNTGGIAGKNLGTIIDAENACGINTTVQESTFNMNDIDTDIQAAIENLTIAKEEEQDKTLESHTDTGGITGYTSGIVQGCYNSGTIGYPHYGYNVGGIAGRQAGYLSACTNAGKVLGRKDVGGIVGQAEPYVILNTSEDILAQLESALDKLQSMVDHTLSDTDASSDKISAHLSSISSYSTSAKDSSQVLVDQITDFIDSNMDEINTQGVLLADTLDKLEPIFSDMETASDTMTTALEEMHDALDTVEITYPDLGKAVDQIKLATEDLSKASDAAGSGAEQAKKALTYLRHAVIIRDQHQINTALDDLALAINALANAKQAAEDALAVIKDTLSQLPDSLKGLIANLETIIQAVGDLQNVMRKSFAVLSELGDAIAVLAKNLDMDFTMLRMSAKQMGNAMEDLAAASRSLSSGLTNLSAALDEAHTALSGYGDQVTGQADTVLEILSNASSHLAYASDYLTTAVTGIKDIVAHLANEEPIAFTTLGEPFRQASGDLFSTLTNIGNEVDSLKTTVSSEGKILTNNLQAINNQFHTIMELVAGEFETLGDRNSDKDPADFLVDISDQDIWNTKQGKIAQCKNTGTIEADRNVGGIAGAMSIEYTADPEDDIPKPTTFHFTYQTKAVLQGCINRGEIIGKKDCIGGIAGRMDLGTIYGCESYADVESTEGDYVGGVAGWAMSTLQNSYAKCAVAGESYVGGIAGKASSLNSCYTIVKVTGTESAGAVAGEGSDTNKKIRQNYFVDHGMGGIDGISYAGTAQPITYDALCRIEGIPLNFVGFTVTFQADGETVETQSVKYGSPLKWVVTPKIPEKEGYFGTWPSFDEEAVEGDVVVEAVYTPWITVLASEEKQGALSLGLAEGQFTDKAVLHITDSAAESPVKPKTSETSVVWDIRLKGTSIKATDTVPVRLLNQDRCDATVWAYKNGTWETIDVRKRGKYLEVSMQGTAGTFCVLYQPASVKWLHIVLPIAGVLVVGLAAWKLYQRKKKGKSINTEQKNVQV